MKAAETILPHQSDQGGRRFATSSDSHHCSKLTNYEQGSEGHEMPLSAHLASLSNPVLISDNSFGFCEAAWPCLAVGGAGNEPNSQHRLRGGEVGTQWVKMGFSSPFHGHEKALRMVSDVCYHILFLCFH